MVNLRFLLQCVMTFAIFAFTTLLPAEETTATFNVEDYGAIPDDKKSDTLAIQRAIDQCHQQKGGVVVLNRGQFQAGTIFLRDRVTLEVKKNAILRASKKLSDFQQHAWIIARDASHIGLKGKGIITGNGSSYFQIEPRRILAWITSGAKSGAVKHPIKQLPIPYIYSVQFSNCQDVSICDLRFNDSPHWTIHTLACDRVSINNVKIKNLFYGPYTDGFDIDACNDVKVTNCEVTAGDDAFCVKNTNKRGLARPCSNIVFENCIARSATNGFKIGTETQDDISNVTFRNCRVEPAGPGASSISGIAIETVDGGNLSNVTVEDIHMTAVRVPIFIRLGNRGRGQSGKQKVPGTLRNVNIRRVKVEWSTRTSVFSGIPGSDIENVVLDDIDIKVAGGNQLSINALEIPELEADYPEAIMFGILPAYGLFARHVNGLKISNLRIQQEAADIRPQTKFIDVKQLVESP